jgi:hypothetical protein
MFLQNFIYLRVHTVEQKNSINIFAVVITLNMNQPFSVHILKVGGKSVSVLNETPLQEEVSVCLKAPPHEVVCVSEGIAPRILKLDTWQRRVVRFPAFSPYPGPGGPTANPAGSIILKH